MSELSRRGFLIASSGVAGGLTMARATVADIVRTDISRLPPYGNSTIPSGIRSRAIANVNGMTVPITTTRAPTGKET